jgi:SM-20-related protein
MSLLDLDALAATPLMTDPFDYVLVENFVRPDAAEAIGADYPAIDKPGSFALEDVTTAGAFAALIEEMDGPAFRAVIERKFGLSLEDLPTTFTVRGMCGPADGNIHTDSKTKVITVLLYLNPKWAEDGGRLKLLRDGEDLEAVAAEAPPDFGSLLIFRRSDHSWHGHKPFIGPRRVVQMNWVTSQRVAGWQKLRHRLSAAIKRLTPGERPKSDAA